MQEAATREIREEFNIQIEIQQVFDVFDRIFRDLEGRVQFHYVLIECMARYKSGELRPADDVEEAEWVDLQDLARYALPRDQMEVIMRVAQKKCK